MAKAKIELGSYVAWKWLNGIAEGKVIEIHNAKTKILIKDKMITRNGTIQNPAIVIEQKSGNKVLKLLSEVQITK